MGGEWGSWSVECEEERPVTDAGAPVLGTWSWWLCGRHG